MMKKLIYILCLLVVCLLGYCIHLYLQTKPNKDLTKKKTITIKGVTFNMLMVKGGTFTMGCTEEQGGDCYDNEKPAHQVTLSDYYMGETEVTQELWQAVMGTTVSQQRDKTNKEWSLSGVGNNYPMYYISYDECLDFIKKLNILTNMTFRLPTEAEWEYAARGGQKSKGYKYAGSDDLELVAWFLDNSSDETLPVATKQPNELGLYDMSGNVWEWCQDLDGSYPPYAQTNPTGPSSGSYRVSRGGSWYDDEQFCRVSDRYGSMPTARYCTLGLRLVLLP